MNIQDIAAQLSEGRPDIKETADAFLRLASEMGEIQCAYDGNASLSICGGGAEKTAVSVRKAIVRMLCARLGQMIKLSGKAGTNLYGDNGIVVPSWASDMSAQMFIVRFRNTPAEQSFVIRSV